MGNMKAFVFEVKIDELYTELGEPHYSRKGFVSVGGNLIWECDLHYRETEEEVVQRFCYRLRELLG